MLRHVPRSGVVGPHEDQPAEAVAQKAVLRRRRHATEGGQGGALPAARILAAAERLREDVGSPPAPNERPGFDRRIAAVQEAIGDEGAFARAWAEGRAMSLEQAIDLALDTAVQPTTNADGWAS